jgi:hypothetical protein
MPRAIAGHQRVELQRGVEVRQGAGRIVLVQEPDAAAQDDDRLFGLRVNDAGEDE